MQNLQRVAEILAASFHFCALSVPIDLLIATGMSPVISIGSGPGDMSCWSSVGSSYRMELRASMLIEKT